MPRQRKDGLETFELHALDAKAARALRAWRPSTPLAHLDPETAAKRYLQHFDAPLAGGVATDFKSLGIESEPLTGTRIVKFRQTLHKIPVYGTLITIELDEHNALIGIGATTGRPTRVNAVAKLSPAEAMRAIARQPGHAKTLDGIVPHLNYYFDIAAAKWRLVYIAEDVPTGPATTAKRQPGSVPKLMDYVVDAHSGAVVAELPRTPTLAGAIQTAVDGLGKSRTFRAETAGSARRRLINPLLNVHTFDFRFRDLHTDAKLLPGHLVTHPPAPWAPAAVSAHANAEAVATFLRLVLLRHNIDNQGGPVISSINCMVTGESNGSKEWINAAWHGTQMVYGQRRDGKGLLSLAINLGVVGHEMFHGVTNFTSRLEYRSETGALNESYSDIFGVIIANYPNPVARKWDWEIGKGLAPSGAPFRDMKDPGRFGQPAHMRAYKRRPLSNDCGGVHLNSGIHNHAAYMILTAPAVNPTEVAAVFYLALAHRLSRTSNFLDSRRAVIASARTLFRHLPPARAAAKIKAIQRGFQSAGIEA